MRVPIPVVVLLGIAVTGGTWWYGTRDKDFLKPPAPEKLAAIRDRVRQSLPPEVIPEEVISPPPLSNEPAPPAEEPKPFIELTDLDKPPELQEYDEITDKGAAHLIELAVLLETEGEAQRALLAWERVLDSGKPDASQTTAAITAIRRLRSAVPEWNTDAKTAVPIVLQAGAARKTVKTLTPLLEQTARDLEHASAGILKVSTKLTPGKDPKNSKAPCPVAIWITGPAKDSRTTEVMSFTPATPEALQEELRKTVFQVIRGYLSRGVGLSIPPPVADGTAVVDAMRSHVTRRQWRVLGKQLNYPMEKPAEKPAKKP